MTPETTCPDAGLTPPAVERPPESGVYDVPVIFPDGWRLLLAVHEGEYADHRWVHPCGDIDEATRLLHRLVEVARLV